MIFNYNCPTCGQSFELRKAVTLTKRRCPRCNTEIRSDEVLKQEREAAELLGKNEEERQIILAARAQADARRAAEEKRTANFVATLLLAGGGFLVLMFLWWAIPTYNEGQRKTAEQQSQWERERVAEKAESDRRWQELRQSRTGDTPPKEPSTVSRTESARLQKARADQSKAKAERDAKEAEAKAERDAQVAKDKVEKDRLAAEKAAADKIIADREAAEAKVKAIEKAKIEAEEDKVKAKEKAEVDAARNLKYAKQFIEGDNPEAAKDKLKGIVDKWPLTKAGKEAKEMLKKFK